MMLSESQERMVIVAERGLPNVWLIVATVIGAGAIPYDEVPLVDAAIVLGNEAHGLGASVVARCDVSATIPLAGPTESLNLAIAGSLFCFEALRQQRQSRRRTAPMTESANNEQQ